MAGSCWRLLAAFLLILVVALLRGQDAADRSPLSEPKGTIPYHFAPVVPVWIPPPSLPRPYPIASGAAGFQSLVRAAGIIFSGRVTFVGRAPASSGPDPGSIPVTFRVEQAMRGTSPGQNLTIREWSGLWTGAERYRVGERVLLFLYSPSRLGLTSPVGGAMGRFAMDSRGRIVMSPQHVANLAADPILGGKTVVPRADFARAVQSSSREE